MNIIYVAIISAFLMTCTPIAKAEPVEIPDFECGTVYDCGVA